MLPPRAGQGYGDTVMNSGPFAKEVREWKSRVMVNRGPVCQVGTWRKRGEPNHEFVTLERPEDQLEFVNPFGRNGRRCET